MAVEYIKHWQRVFFDEEKYMVEMALEYYSDTSRFRRDEVQGTITYYTSCLAPIDECLSQLNGSQQVFISGTTLQGHLQVVRTLVADPQLAFFKFKHLEEATLRIIEEFDAYSGEQHKLEDAAVTGEARRAFALQKGHQYRAKPAKLLSGARSRDPSPTSDKVLEELRVKLEQKEQERTRARQQAMAQYNSWHPSGSGQYQASLGRRAHKVYHPITTQSLRALWSRSPPC